MKQKPLLRSNKAAASGGVLQFEVGDPLRVNQICFCHQRSEGTEIVSDKVMEGDLVEIEFRRKPLPWTKLQKKTLL